MTKARNIPAVHRDIQYSYMHVHVHIFLYGIDTSYPISYFTCALAVSTSRATLKALASAADKGTLAKLLCDTAPFVNWF